MKTSAFFFTLVTLFSLTASRSSPLLQSFLAQQSACDRVYDDQGSYTCIEHTGPAKRSIDEFSAMAMGVKRHLNLIAEGNKKKIDAFFAGADSDKDSMITKEEMRAYVDSTK